MYTREAAEILKAHAGEKWRPSNGMEGEIFAHNVCGTCVAGPSFECRIACASMLYDVTDPEYPAEWQIGPDGLPTCTAWREDAAPQGKA